MPRIFDHNEIPAERTATVASIRALKNQDQKMIEVTAATAEDSAAAEAAGIETVITIPELVKTVREGSRRVFVTAAFDFSVEAPLTEDEMLRAAWNAMLDGADAIATSRRPESVRRLTDEYIPVMGHVGFVPRRSTHFGGIRGVGKTAEEAMAIWDEMRRLEDAGAFAAECELIVAPVMAELTKRSSLATFSLGSGGDADVAVLYTSDICGESDHIPRHARTYADLRTLQRQIQDERVRALTEFRGDVLSGSYPAEAEVVQGEDEELQRFREMLGD